MKILHHKDKEKKAYDALFQGVIVGVLVDVLLGVSLGVFQGVIGLRAFLAVFATMGIPIIKRMCFFFFQFVNRG
jgi:hypothetical protein